MLRRANVGLLEREKVRPYPCAASCYVLRGCATGLHSFGLVPLPAVDNTCVVLPIFCPTPQLVTPHDVDICKQRMNTFAYVGDLKTEPEVACVYHSEEVSWGRDEGTRLCRRKWRSARRLASLTAAVSPCADAVCVGAYRRCTRPSYS